MAGDDVEALIGEHVPRPDGYRFAALERDLGDGVRVQIVDARGKRSAGRQVRPSTM
jgi:hypothetical protein